MRTPRRLGPAGEKRHHYIDMPVPPAWRPWGAEPFDEARRRRCPVLLLLDAGWSPACRRFIDELARAPEIGGLLSRAFVTVRADVDARPDIADRYGLGGWPSLVFLTGRGAVLSGATGLSPAQLADAARRWPALRDASPDLLDAAPVAPAADPPAVDRLDGAKVVERCLAQALAEADRDHGGFGGAPKLPHAWPLRLMLAAGGRGRDGAATSHLRTTLDALCDGPLWDASDLGFFRMAARRDWTGVEPVKTLDVNVALLHVLLEAASAFGDARYGDRAREVTAFVLDTLADPAGGFHASLWHERGAWQRDTTCYADVTARAVRALLRASRALDDLAPARAAIDALERWVPVLYTRGAGIAHVGSASSSIRGWLADQVEVGQALVDAFEISGQPAYRDLAEELARSIATTHAEPGGGFVDRTAAGSDDVGLLALRQMPFVANCEAARLLHRLSRITGDPALAASARATLLRLEPRCATERLDAAAFALACLDVYGEA
jgi:hypothetical protein